MDRLRHIWSVAREKPLMWLSLLLALAILVVAFVFPSPNGGDFRLRFLGMVLQLIGALTVLNDLTATARHFGKPGPIASTMAWFKSFVRGDVTITAVGASMSVFGGKARGKVRTTIRPDALIEDRVTNLESFTKQIDESLDAAYKEMDQNATRLESKIEAEGKARANEIRAVRECLETVTAGNFPNLTFGAVWLIVGIVLATLAPEIAKTINGQGCEVLRSL